MELDQKACEEFKRILLKLQVGQQQI